ncbi:MAG: peptidylprolyl isomerase [Shimia sp.]
MIRQLSIIALCAGLTGAAWAQETTLDTVVATVNGDDITVAHVLDIRRQLPAEYANIPNDVLWNGIVDQLIQQRVLAESIAAPSWLDEALENQRASILAGRAVAELADSAVTEGAARDAYDAQIADFEGETQYNASHILVETEEEAQQIVTDLDGGADFAELAMERSTGPSGPRGGELGWFGAGMMVAPFQEAVETLEVGGVSAPVQTQFGWHVITLNDIRTTEPPAFEAVREDIEGQLRSEALEARIDELRDAAEIARAEGLGPEVFDAVTLD